MAQPVVHFEVVGRDPTRLRCYFSQLFGWSFTLPSPVAEEVFAPNEYGFLDSGRCRRSRIARARLRLLGHLP
jgi:uncharacterized protein